MSIYADWSLVELKAFRKALSKAIATGAARVNFADRGVGYESRADMLSTARALDVEIAEREGTAEARTRQIIPYTFKGFD